MTGLLIDYSREIGDKIKNTECLPAGTGAKYLLCLRGENGEYVAKQWQRKFRGCFPHEIVIRFKSR